MSIVVQYRPVRGVLMILPIVLLCGGGCARSMTLSRFEYRQLEMGVQARMVVYAEKPQIAEEACRAAYARVAQLEDIFSDYRPTSEAMRLCAKSGGRPAAVSSELFDVLSRAVEISRRTDGAFDVTVGPYVQLWRTARKSGVLPSPEELQRARRSVGWPLIRLNPANHTVQLLAPDMRLDFGGIAKGYAGDQAIAVLESHGIRRALFEAGGDIVVSGPPPGKRGWTIELPGLANQPKSIELKDASVSTSGDAVQSVQIDGRRYSHVVDPTTGVGLSEHFAATVVAPKGILSDALSTALTVMGPERGMKLARRYPNVRAWIGTTR
jgi:thiamine biosynthesis lipoprotein